MTLNIFCYETVTRLMHFPLEQVNFEAEQSENVRICSDPFGKLQMPLSPFVDLKKIM